MSEITTGAAGAGGGGQGSAGGAGAGGGGAGATGAGGGASGGAAQGGAGAAQGGGAAAGGAAGGGGASWIDSLSAEFKADPGLQGFKTADELAKSYLHAQKMIGADKIVLPGKHATEQDWNDVFAKLGRPENADKYELNVEGLKPEDTKEFREAAFKAGLLPKQVEAVMAFDQARQKQVAELSKQSRESLIKTGLEGLKKEWAGKDGAEYQENLNRAGMALNTIGKDFLEWADKCGVGDDPMFIKLMNNVGKMMKEDTLRGAGGSASFGESRASLQGKIDAIMGNGTHPYWDRSHPGHKGAVDEVAALQDMAMRAK